MHGETCKIFDLFSPPSSIVKVHLNSGSQVEECFCTHACAHVS